MTTTIEAGPATTTLDEAHQGDDGIARHLRAMQDRSRALRRQARGLDPVLARAYRRRAAEIQLGAWAYAARTGHPDWALSPP